MLFINVGIWDFEAADCYEYHLSLYIATWPRLLRPDYQPRLVMF